MSHTADSIPGPNDRRLFILHATAAAATALFLIVLHYIDTAGVDDGSSTETEGNGNEHVCGWCGSVFGSSLELGIHIRDDHGVYGP